MKQTIRYMSWVIAVTALAITGCKKDTIPEPRPTIDNIEVGLNNNEIGVVGQDFHFNADIIAGNKIENVLIKILPRNGETYTSKWQFELVWDEYNGLKNANIHKHFDLPEDAVEGKYDFLIIINDQNGTQWEEKRAIMIYSKATLPVNPSVGLFMMLTNKIPFYINTRFVNGNEMKKDDEIKTEVTINDIKGDGKMYFLLINKKLNHRPESIAKIDFSKAIVYDVVEHKDLANTGSFSNGIINPETYEVIRSAPILKIGAVADNNFPTPGSINGEKAWETGTYYFGFIYHNSTYNMGLFNYIEVSININ